MLPLKLENNLFIDNKLTSRDMLKIGLLYLNNGVWKGQQVIPKSWIEKTTSSHITFKPGQKTKGYGYLWWQRVLTSENKSYHAFYAAGAGGQYIVVVPALDLVTVFTGNSNNHGQAFEIVEKYILPSIIEN